MAQDATSMQEVVGSSNIEEQQGMSEEENSKEEESEERLEETLAQKMRSRREGALKKVEGKPMVHSCNVFKKRDPAESMRDAMDVYDPAWRRVNAGIFPNQRRAEYDPAVSGVNSFFLLHYRSLICKGTVTQCRM